jgi:hypothetical protein
MPLTDAQVRELEQNRSRYGCGVQTCRRCYPIQYGCDFCEAQFPPILNGEHYVCVECGYDNKEKN